MNKIKALIANYPVRVYFYSVIAALLAAAVVVGLVDSSAVTVWLGVAAVVLGVPATEVVHSSVSPVSSVGLDPPKAD